MKMQFANRIEAGQRLAGKLIPYKDRSDVLVLALPRGGVVVGHEVARELNAPLDVFVVRKLGLPGHEELAMGAIASGGRRVLNGNIVETLQIPDEVIDAVAAKEMAELERRERNYREGRPMPEVYGRTVILVDDGIATGSTMQVAIEALRQFEPSRLVVAAPTVALSTLRQMRHHVDEIVAVMTPADFVSVGEWYIYFPQTTDEEVHAYLQQANQISHSPAS